MCSSYVENIPVIIHAIAAYRPNKVVDFGMGNGKYGFLIREYFYERESGAQGTWPHVKEVIGVDVWEGYQKGWHKHIYDELIFGNALELEPPKADLYLMIDTPEHWPKDQAKKLIDKCLVHGAVLISTPRDIGDQGASHGNEWERHITQWYPGDFQNYPLVKDMSDGTPSYIYLISNGNR